MATFILIPGGWQGGWAFEAVADLLVAHGHNAEPGKIRALVYSDAYVPASGDSVWSLTSQQFRDAFVAGAAADGLTCAPPPHLDARCRPHPMGTFLQAITLSGRWRDVPRKVFVGAHGWNGSPFIDLYRRLSADPAWTTFAFDCGHNIPRLKPDAFVEILLAQV